MGNGFAKRFARYLLTKRNLIDSAMHKNLFRLKRFLNWAPDNGYPVIADPKKFSWQHREPDILTLTRQEVQCLDDLDLSARPALCNARALFMLGVYTGLRFSDVANLRPEHIQADRLRVITQKTRLTVTVPIRAATEPQRPAPLLLTSNVATLCLGSFKPTDLRDLLTSLGVLDADNGHWHLGGLKGKAAAPLSAFPAAYWALFEAKLMLFADAPVYRKAFEKEFHVRFSDRLATFKDGSGCARFQDYLVKARRWITL